MTVFLVTVPFPHSSKRQAIPNAITSIHVKVPVLNCSPFPPAPAFYKVPFEVSKGTHESLLQTRPRVSSANEIPKPSSHQRGQPFWRAGAQSTSISGSLVLRRAPTTALATLAPCASLRSTLAWKLCTTATTSGSKIGIVQVVHRAVIAAPVVHRVVCREAMITSYAHGTVRPFLKEARSCIHRHFFSTPLFSSLFISLSSPLFEIITFKFYTHRSDTTPLHPVKNCRFQRHESSVYGSTHGIGRTQMYTLEGFDNKHARRYCTLNSYASGVPAKACKWIISW